LNEKLKLKSNPHGNSNVSGISLTPEEESSGVGVVNVDNGSGSQNSGSVIVDSDDTTTQTNSASVVNNLQQETKTGDNSASKNVGNSKIETGDASTTGTLITAVNTNVDGVMVSEFNVVDDHLGDIILDFDSVCLSGCLGDDMLVKNSGNGVDSTNDAHVNAAVDSLTFQQNDASVENSMILESDSGNNSADKNTGGDSIIETGDASVSANALTFANNNLEGNVIYSVVNIFGDLVGDLIFPEGMCCFESATAQNMGNGADSQNSADLDLSNTDLTYQFNNVDIKNNLIIYADTGENVTSKNTGGSSSIETGKANVEAEVVNIANTNIAGGDWWLVIVNEAGNWVGKILGAPVGALFAGSSGFDISENEEGEFFVTNSGNGANSQNTISVNQDMMDTTVQTNTADITNNLNLSANTGDNSASRNTGGDSSITTGDANVIANLVNFVNNNVSGGRLFVNVVNVFGSWLGDFVSPGHEKQDSSLPLVENGNNATGGVSNPSGDPENSGNNSVSNSASSNPETEYFAEAEPSSGNSFVVGSTVQGNIISGFVDGFSQAAENVGDSNEAADTEIASQKVLSVNLAWGIFLLPIVGLLIIRRRKAYVKLNK
jgi:hypothetical protein